MVFIEIFLLGILATIIWILVKPTREIPTRSRTDPILIKLDEYNYHDWKLCLSFALECDGSANAIEQPLSQSDPINLRAMTRIIGTIPDHLIGKMGTTRIAYYVIKELEAKFGCLDYSRLSRLEENIQAMTLAQFDEKSVNEHLTQVGKRIQQLKNGGAQIDRMKELWLIASTLPKEWSRTGFADVLRFGNHSVEDGEAMIREKCRLVRSNTDNSGNNQSRSKKTKSDREKEEIREKDRKEGRCFYCHNRDRDGNELPRHIVMNCPLKNNKEVSQYSQCKSIKLQESWRQPHSEKPSIMIATMNEKLKNDPRPKCKIEIDDQKYIGIIDSGSTITILPSSAIPKKNAPPTFFTMADGKTKIFTRGPIDLRFKINEQIIEWPIYIQEAKEAIIGADILKNYNVVVNMTDGSFKFNVAEITENVSLKKIDENINKPDHVNEFIATIEDTQIIEPISSIKKQCSEIVMNEFPELFKGIGLYDGMVHEIDTGNNHPITIPQYRMPLAYIQEMADHVKEMIQEDIIEESFSEWKAPWLRVPKKDGSFRMVIDYRKLNEVTKRDTFPMPRIDEILERLGKSKIFSRLDLRKGYYQIMIKKEDRPKTAFSFGGKLYQFRRMPFGLCEAPRTFQRSMQKILGDLNFVEIYLDDIAIHSQSIEEHIEHLRIVLDKIKKANLRLNSEKCQFGDQEIEFLGFKIIDGKKMPSDEKRKIFANFPKPNNQRMLQGFLGLANFVRHLIPDFAQLAQPLFKASNMKKFIWTEECEQNFTILKKRLAESDNIFIPDLNKPFIVTCDASETGMGAILSQNVDEKRQIVEFMSRMFNPTKKRYSTIEKEATAIWWALDHWQHFLKGVEFIIESDHKPLQWLLSMSNANPKLGRMAQKIQAEFKIKGIEYIKGDDNLLADTLSRIELGLLNDIPGTPSEQIRLLMEKDPNRFQMINDRIYLVENEKKRLCISSTDEKQIILKEIHDKAGHLGIFKCQETIRDRFYWPNWRRDVKLHLRKCIQCAMAKNDRETNREKLQIQESSFTWERIHIDLCGPLSLSNNNKYIIVIQDAYSKWLEAKAIANPTTTIIINWLQTEIFSRFGFPTTITSDQGSQFESVEFKNFCKNNGILHHLTSSYHHISNGLVERANQTLEAMLRTSINNQDEWSNILPQCIWSYNISKHHTTGVSPYSLMFGREARTKIDQIFQLDTFDLDAELNNVIANINRKTTFKRMKKNYDRQQKDGEFKEGDLVLWHVAEQGVGKSQKLNKKWKGPFQVTHVEKPSVILSDRLGKTKRIHMNHIKRFEADLDLIEFRGRGRPRNPGGRCDDDAVGTDLATS